MSDGQPAAGEGSLSQRRVALAAASTSAFLIPFTSASVNVALPRIGADFGAGAVELGWVSLSFMTVASALLLPAGRFADIKGRKRAVMTGVFIFLLGSAGAFLSRSIGELIAARTVQGAGAAMMFGTAAALLVSVFPPSERGRALGFNTAAVYVGLSLGPVAGGFLTEHAGWRSLFALNVPVGALLLWILGTRLKGEWAEARGEGFDWPGSALYAGGMALIVLGLTAARGPAGGALALAGAAGLAGFVVREVKADHPLLDLKVLKGNRVFVLSSAAAFASYAATAGSGFLLSLYLQNVKLLEPSAAGMVLLVQPVVMALVSPLAGRLSDRVEPRFVASAGMALTAAGLAGLAALGRGSPVAHVVAGVLLLGLGFGAFSSPNMNAILGSVDRRSLGVASATAGTMRLTGQMTSIAVVMAVLAALMGRGAVTPELAGPFLKGLRLCFAIFAVMCAAGVAASLARGRLRPGV